MARKIVTLLDYIKGKYVQFSWDDVYMLHPHGSYVDVTTIDGAKYMFDRALFNKALLK